MGIEVFKLPLTLIKVPKLIHSLFSVIHFRILKLKVLYLFTVLI